MNPGGRPKGSMNRKTSMKISDRLLGKWKVHPADKLVELARYLTENGKYEEAAEIWTNLMKYFEPTKKPVESAPEKTTPEEAKDAAEETFRLLQEIENGTYKDTTGSKGLSVEKQPSTLPSEASSETHLPEHKG